jgi:hypothetical protein
MRIGWIKGVSIANIAVMAYLNVLVEIFCLVYSDFAE